MQVSMKRASAVALLAALACIPASEVYGQSTNASERGQQMGQGIPGTLNPNAGPGNNSGSGAPGSGGGSATDGGPEHAGPEEGHSCGGEGHVDNDAPGHQHDDCVADGMATGAISARAAPGSAAAQANAAAGGGVVSIDCSGFHEDLLPIFGRLTPEEQELVATADSAALVPVTCVDASTDPDAQRLVSENATLANALSANGYRLDQVITVDVGDVPTIYVEATTE